MVTENVDKASCGVLCDFDLGHPFVRVVLALIFRTVS
jgi:hypothetical protein